MTKKELSQLYYLNREIEMNKLKLQELEEASTNSNQKITGLPFVSGISDKVGNYAAEIADLKGIIEASIQRCFYELNRLNRYITSIDDEVVRQVVAYRYVNGLSWKEVERMIGGGNSYESLRKRLDRYLKKK